MTRATLYFLAGGFTRRVQAFGTLAVYGDLPRRTVDPGPGTMSDWFDLEHYPPKTLRDLNPVIDVEDLAQVNMVLDNGVLATYAQCHFTPDYWRNYTVIGDEGRLENVGDGDGGMVDAKIVATNSAALGLDRLPSRPRRQAENSERRGSSGNRLWPMAGAERLNSFNPSRSGSSRR